MEARGHAGAPLGPLAWALALLPLAGLWSLVDSVDRAKSVTYVGSLVMLMLFAMLYARFAATPLEARRVATAFVITSTALCVVVALQLFWPGFGIGVRVY